MRKFTDKKLVIATHNKGKLAEIQSLFQPFGVEVTSAGELGLDEPEETETSFIGNARIKAQAAVQCHWPARPGRRQRDRNRRFRWRARRLYGRLGGNAERQRLRNGHDEIVEPA